MKKFIFSDIVVTCWNLQKELGALAGELSMFIVHRDERKKILYMYIVETK